MVESAYKKALDKLKSANVLHAVMGGVVSSLIMLGGVAMVCTGFGAYMGKAMIQTGINGIFYCVQAAIQGRFSWKEFALEQGVSFVSACLFPYVTKLGYKMLLTAATTFIKDGLNSLITGKQFNFKQTATASLIGICTMGIQEKLGINQLLYGSPIAEGSQMASEVLSASIATSLATNFFKGAVSSTCSNVIGQALNIIVNYKKIDYEDFRRSLIEYTYVEDLDHIEQVWNELITKKYVHNGSITDKCTQVINKTNSSLGLSKKLNIYDDVTKTILIQFSLAANFSWTSLAFSTLQGGTTAGITAAAQLRGQQNQIRQQIKQRINEISTGKGSNSISLKVLSNVDETKLQILDDNGNILMDHNGENKEEVKIQFAGKHYAPLDSEGNAILISSKEGDCAFDAYAHETKQVVEDVKTKTINALLNDPIKALQGVSVNEMRVGGYLQGGSIVEYNNYQLQKNQEILNRRHQEIEKRAVFVNGKYFVDFEGGIYEFEKVNGQYRVLSATRTFTEQDFTKGSATNRNTREIANAMSSSKCDAGHIFSKASGGSGTNPINIVPQDPSLNRGTLRMWESYLTDDIKHGPCTSGTVNVKFNYDSRSSLCPTKMTYNMVSNHAQGYKYGDISVTLNNRL